MDSLNMMNNHLLFLKARDPSILTGNKGFTRENLRVNLAPESLQESSALEETDIQIYQNDIQIYLRVKYAENMRQFYNISENEIQCYLPNASSSCKNIKDIESVIKKYKFSHIFTANSVQEEVFNLVVKPKVLNFINGENGTLMSYGASGSGKTFTIIGTTSHPGIVPRTLEYLFRALPKLSTLPLIKPTQSGEVEILENISAQEQLDIRKNLLAKARDTINEEHTNIYREMQQRLSTEPVAMLDDLSNVILGVWVSFAEIYNEHIYDLLTPLQNLNTRPKLQLGSFNENTYIKNLTNVSISSGIEAYQILQYGLHNLNYASTSINSHSSRSHCIFTIKIAQLVKGTDCSRVNYFNFCDLAGSERLKKTLNVGARLKESKNINTSLLVLGRCFNCIRESQKKKTSILIPYRESKLTRLFQRALTGFEAITMIVNMNPCIDMIDENQHVLNFSALAKEIVIKRPVLKPKKKNRFSLYLQSKSSDFNGESVEKNEPEIAKLHDIIDILYTELEQRNVYCVGLEQRIRAEMINKYTQTIDEVKQHYQKMIAHNESRHREHLQMMKSVYTESSNDDEVINLDSSDDEAAECSKIVGSHLQHELQESKRQNSILSTKLMESSRTHHHQEMEIAELKQTLEHAKEAYDDMCEQYESKINELIVENIELKEINSDLNMEIECTLSDKEKDEILP